MANEAAPPLSLRDRVNNRVNNSESLLALNRISGPAMLAVLAFCGVQLWMMSSEVAGHGTKLVAVDESLASIDKRLDQIDAAFVLGRNKRDAQFDGVGNRINALEIAAAVFRVELDAVKDKVAVIVDRMFGNDGGRPGSPHIQ